MAVAVASSNFPSPSTGASASNSPRVSAHERASAFTFLPSQQGRQHEVSEQLLVILVRQHARLQLADCRHPL